MFFHLSILLPLEMHSCARLEFALINVFRRKENTIIFYSRKDGTLARVKHVTEFSVVTGTVSLEILEEIFYFFTEK